MYSSEFPLPKAIATYKISQNDIMTCSPAKKCVRRFKSTSKIGLTIFIKEIQLIKCKVPLSLSD